MVYKPIDLGEKRFDIKINVAGVSKPIEVLASTLCYAIEATLLHKKGDFLTQEVKLDEPYQIFVENVNIS